MKKKILKLSAIVLSLGAAMSIGVGAPASANATINMYGKATYNDVYYGDCSTFKARGINKSGVGSVARSVIINNGSGTYYGEVTIESKNRTNGEVIYYNESFGQIKSGAKRTADVKRDVGADYITYTHRGLFKPGATIDYIIDAYTVVNKQDN